MCYFKENDVFNEEINLSPIISGSALLHFISLNNDPFFVQFKCGSRSNSTRTKTAKSIKSFGRSPEKNSKWTRWKFVVFCKVSNEFLSDFNVNSV